MSTVPAPTLPPTGIGQSNPSALLKALPQPGSEQPGLAVQPGARVVAEVVALQAPGQWLLRLGRGLFTAAVPGAYTPGQKLDLVVLSERGGPEPGVSVQVPGRPASGAAVATAPLTVFLARVSDEAGAYGSPDGARLSETGRWISRLAQGSDGAAALRDPQPIVPQGALPDRSALAAALAQRIERSGLFYESHLLAWFQGQQPTAALRLEPQAAFASSAAEPPATPQEASGAALQSFKNESNEASFDAGVPAKMLEKGQAQGVEEGQRDAGSPDTRAATRAATRADLAAGAARADADARETLAPTAARVAVESYRAIQAQLHVDTAWQVPQGLHGTVQQQLALLAQPALEWSGWAWPGQPMRWRIERDQGRAPGGGEAEASSGWQTRLELELPTLGPVQAWLRLGPQRQLAIRVEHAPAAADRLEAHRAELSAALAALGLRVDAVELIARAVESREGPVDGGG
jgi:hypothetical protein